MNRAFADRDSNTWESRVSGKQLSDFIAFSFPHSRTLLVTSVYLYSEFRAINTMKAPKRFVGLGLPETSTCRRLSSNRHARPFASIVCRRVRREPRLSEARPLQARLRPCFRSRSCRPSASLQRVRTRAPPSSRAGSS